MRTAIRWGELWDGNQRDFETFFFFFKRRGKKAGKKKGKKRRKKRGKK